MMANEVEVQEAAGRDLLEYLEIPLRYPRHMWIPFAVIFTFGVLLALVAPRKYRSATLILVETRKVPDYFVTPLGAEGIDKRLQIVRQVVLSRTRLESVAQKLDPHPELAGAPSSVVVEQMRRAIAIRVQGNDAFTIEYVNRDPRMAMLVTNMLAEQFIEDAKHLREDTTQQAADFIEQNLSEARRALEQREEGLRQLKLKHWGALPEQLDASLRLLTQMQFEQQTLGETLRALESRRIVLEQTLVEQRPAAEGSASSDAVTQEALVKLNQQLAALRDRYTEEHPDVRALRLRVARLEERLAARPETTAIPEADPRLRPIHQSLDQVEREIAVLRARRTKLDERIADLQRRVEQTPRVEQELTALTRDYQQLKENYTELLKKDLDARMARRMEEHWQGGYFRILDPANLPQRPIRSYGFLFLGAGLVLGLLAGLIASFVADQLDHSVKSVRELESLLPYPVLAVVPRAAAGRRA